MLLNDGVIDSAEKGEATEGVGKGFEVALKDDPNFCPFDGGGSRFKGLSRGIGVVWQ